MDYDLAWMREYVTGLWASGHVGGVPVADIWLFYNQTEDIGVFHLTNGNPGYSRLPVGGLLTVRLILGLLFTKEGTLGGELQPEFIVSSDSCFTASLIKPRLMFYGNNYS